MQFVQFQQEVGGGTVTSFFHKSKSKKSRKTLCEQPISKGASFRKVGGKNDPESGICSRCILIEEDADPVFGPFQHGRILAGRS